MTSIYSSPQPQYILAIIVGPYNKHSTVAMPYPNWLEYKKDLYPYTIVSEEVISAEDYESHLSSTHTFISDIFLD